MSDNLEKQFGEAHNYLDDKGASGSRRGTLLERIKPIQELSTRRGRELGKQMGERAKLEAKLTHQEAVVEAAREYVKFSPKSGRTSMDNAWMDLVEALEQADE